MKEVVEEVVDMLTLRAKDKNLTVQIDLENNCFISANRDRIKQMIINLIDNAIKYTEKGGVTIKLETASPWVKLSVADTGIGFDEKHKERLFERFYRVDKGRSRSHGGTGLGLSIVKHIVLLYKGKIEVESEPGKGTRFEIDIPESE
jgi:two-component system phosphate regulon sensor histidine kinase PhoR